MTTSGRLQGKIALVTGAGSVGPGWGNGRAIAARFAQEGAQVIGLDRELSRLKETSEQVLIANGTPMVEMSCDVTKSSGVAALVADVIERFGRIDVLVNNVGGSAKGGVVEMTEEVWDAQMNHNLKSVFLMCKNVVPHMLSQGAGSIVNISSTSGIRWSGSAQIGYASTKAAIIQFSRVMAVQHAKQGLRVNTVVPGQLHTPMVESRLVHQRTGGDLDKLLEQRQSRIPLPFMGDGRDTANAALFLASDEARFITATEIIVDGGMSARCD